jgi:putative endonuclease
MTFSDLEPNLGELGEQLVALWLQQQGWKILHQRWYCRWGELDLIAIEGERESGRELNLPQTHLPVLAFVEVKTRRRSNWDADGLLAINRAKQVKLCQAARLFLAQYPDLSDFSCRFDVALVKCQSGKNISLSKTKNLPSKIEIGQKVSLHGYHLTLQDYISSAFDAV